MIKPYEKKFFGKNKIFPSFTVFPIWIFKNNLENLKNHDFNISCLNEVPSFISQIFTLSVFKIDEKTLGFICHKDNKWTLRNVQNLVPFPEQDLFDFEEKFHSEKEKNIYDQNTLFEMFFNTILKKNGLPYWKFKLEEYSQENQNKIIDTLSKSEHLSKILKSLNSYFGTLYVKCSQYYTIISRYDHDKKTYCAKNINTLYPFTKKQSDYLKEFVPQYLKNIDVYTISAENTIEKKFEKVYLSADNYGYTPSLSSHEIIKIKQFLKKENFDFSVFESKNTENTENS